ncbi:hypothetical protein SSP24_78510 [Streptomyces spinoverrucosus]|uniref:ABM domain-containing protein n=1 Tax=Streptomyces spinoverrucosus TaxID=284043 RepID=A0A4Y3VYT7_9ACTN|nr:antibiotic biosynthesis monooxygenase [Streptomyces spinoverrucosus]GEC10196.1 hypothetical protein SSP24_78510 [Streptomyces spinoverrucosus]GHB98333.1 hypothetical protein GCM10010397_83510 [Streptomyces spinoverrucosus]
MTGIDRRSPARGRTDPVTVLVERRVLPGREEEFRSWAYGILAEAADFPGYLGGGVLHPAAADDRWHLVYRFTDQASLHAWESSPHNERCLHHGRELHELVRTRHLSGLEDYSFCRTGPRRPAGSSLSWQWPPCIPSRSSPTFSSCRKQAAFPQPCATH